MNRDSCWSDSWPPCVVVVLGACVVVGAWEVVVGAWVVVGPASRTSWRWWAWCSCSGAASRCWGCCPSGWRGRRRRARAGAGPRGVPGSSAWSASARPRVWSGVRRERAPRLGCRGAGGSARSQARGGHRPGRLAQGGEHLGGGGPRSGARRGQREGGLAAGDPAELAGRGGHVPPASRVGVHHGGDGPGQGAACSMAPGAGWRWPGAGRWGWTGARRAGGPRPPRREVAPSAHSRRRCRGPRPGPARAMR